MADSHRFAAFEAALAEYAKGVHGLDPGASDEEIAQVEIVLSRPIPATYREFLMRHNGIMLFHDTTALYGAPRNQFPKMMDLVKANRGRRWPGMPTEWFIIGSYAWGDDISLTTVPGTDQVKVTRWDHERGSVAETWASFEEWLSDTMNSGARAINYDGSNRHFLREQAQAVMRRLLGK